MRKYAPQDMNATEKKLNTEQLDAIRHGNGPLLIIAGAGTGKTTVITERIAYLITERKIAPSEILALTFTEKAAREMEERVDQKLPYGYTDMWISTFHAFADRILRQEGIHIGIHPGYKVMTEAETVMFFRKHLFAFRLEYFRPLGNPTKCIEGMLTHFSRLKDEDITSQQYLQWTRTRVSKQSAHQTEEEKKETQMVSELASAYQTYEKLKNEEGVMDFAGLIANALRLFRKRENILQAYRSQFKYILIDEFQDTNFAQNELAILLAGREANITVVGDDDQAIYRWRGAAISNIMQFRKKFPTAKRVVLKKNYRSTKNILDASYKLIQHNNPDRLEETEGIDKKLINQRKQTGDKPILLLHESPEDEAEDVARKILSIKEQSRTDEKEQYTWSDCAILVRANNHAEPFMRALQRAGIPFQFLGPGKLFRQDEVIDLIAYLRVLDDFTDSVAMFRILSLPVFQLPARDTAACISFARKIGSSLFEAIEQVAENQQTYTPYLPRMQPTSKHAIKTIVGMIHKHLEMKRRDTAGHILYDFLQSSGMLEKLSNYATLREERYAQNIAAFFSKLKTFEINNSDASVSAVIAWINMAMELGESPLAATEDWSENDAVNILTVHSSKGLEFANVFLVNLVTNRFPSVGRREQIPIPDALVKEILPQGDPHLQEERRVFYVGMTRAKDRVFLSAAKFYGEGIRERKLSPFVSETLGPGCVKKREEREKQGKQLFLLEWKKPALPHTIEKRQPISYLSYSQINTFLTCPLQYKYRYVLKIPVPTTAAASYGTSIHTALQRFYQSVKQKQQPSKDDLLTMLENVWVPIGYGTRAYEEKMKQRGKVMLTGFYEKAYDPTMIPESLEQIFKIKLSPTLHLGGKIDRIDRKPSGELEIIDYKTGRQPSGERMQKNLQMTVYALAASDPGTYNQPPERIILSFYFLETQEKISSTRTKEEMEETRQRLLKVHENIETSGFSPTPGKWCDFCDFRLICPAWKKTYEKPL